MKFYKLEVSSNSENNSLPYYDTASNAPSSFGNILIFVLLFGLICGAINVYWYLFIKK